MANAIVQTDFSDYPPGSTALMNASGFDPNATIQFTVQIMNADGTLGAPATWLASGDAAGNAATTFYVDQIYANTTILLTATEVTVAADGTTMATGPVATEVFTDALGAASVGITKNVTSITDTNGDGLVDAGDVINYQVKATNTGNATLTNVAITDPLTGGVLVSGVTLNAGQNSTVNTSYIVTQADVDANAAIKNTATVTDTQTQPSSASVSTAVSYAPNVSLTKTVASITDTNGDGMVDAGDVINYKIVATNTGDVTLTGVTVADPLTGDPLLSNGTLAVGTSTTLTSSYIITQAQVDSGSTIVNTATVTDNQNKSASATVSTKVDSAPNVSLVKTVTSITDTNGDGLTDAGDVINYKVVATNTGDVTLTGVTVADPLTGAPLASNVILGVGASDTLTTSYTLTQGDVDAGGPVTNTATVTDNQNVSATSSVSTPVDYAPSVSLVKTVTSITDTNGNGLIDAGDVINYKVVAANTGDVTLTGVTVTDPLTGSTLASNVILGVGASDTLTTSYTLTQMDVDANKSVTNTATLTDNQTPSVNASVSTQPDYAPNVSLVKTVTSVTDTNGDGMVDAGDVIHYKVVATNTGDVTLTGVTVADPLTGSALASNVILGVGASDTLTASYIISQVDVDANKAITNTATLTDDQTPSVNSSVSTQVTYAPNVALAKTVTSITDTNGNGITDAGDVINYKVVATNTGDVTLTGVTITDPLSGGTLASNVVLGVGISDAVTTSYVVTQADIDAHKGITNTATVTDDQKVSATSSVSTGLNYTPSVTLTKTVTSVTDTNGDGLVDAGDVINYQVKATNNGDVTLTGVAINDPLTGGLLASGVTLGVGASDTVTTSYIVTQANVDANAAITNTATVTDDQNVSANASTSTNVGYAPKVALTKTVTSITDTNHDGITDAGDVINYKIVATNTGDVDLTGVKIVDPLSGGTLVSGVNLGVGASDTVTTSYTLTAANIGSFVNTATVSDDQNVSASASASTTVGNVPAAVGLIKTVTSITDTNHDGLVDAGDVINYKIVATNTGGVTLTGVKIVDPLSGGTLASNVTLAVGASDTVTTSYKLTQANVDAGGNFVNTATVSDNQTASVSASVSTALSYAPGLTLSKTVTSITQSCTITQNGNNGCTLTDRYGNSCTINNKYSYGCTVTDNHNNCWTITDHNGNSCTVTNTGHGWSTVSNNNSNCWSIGNNNSGGVDNLTDAGDVINYKITATNTGDVTLTGVKIVDPLSGGTLASNVTLAVGQTYNVTTSYTITQANVDANAPLVNIATATDNQTAPVSASASTTLSYAPGLSLTKTVTSITQSCTITSGSNGCSFTDKYGNNCTINNNYGSGCTVTNNHDNSWTISDRYGNNCNVSYNSNSGWCTSSNNNYWSCNSNNGGSNNGNGLVDAGDTVNYKITATNTGDVTLTGVTIVDPTTGGTLASNVTLAVGQTYSVNTSYTITQANVDAHAALVNTATATDNQTAAVNASASTILAYAPNVSLAKTVTSITDTNHDGLVDAGDVVNYKIVASNTGDVTLTGVAINDPLSGGTLASNLTIAVGGSSTVNTSYTITQANVDAHTALVNKATVTDNQTSAVSATATTSLSYCPDVTLIKTVSSILDVNHDGLTDAGDVINYKITATNTGDVSLTGVKIVDSTAGGTLASNVSLALGASSTVSASHTLTQADINACGPSYGNTATVSSTQGASDSASVATLVQNSNCYNIQGSNTKNLTISGTSSAENIIAGTGGDTLTGNGGDDNYVLNAAGKDVIKDKAANLDGTSVINFSSLDSIDLTNVAYGSHTTIGFSNYANGAIMTVSDGSHTASIQLLGQFAAASFHEASDGGAGTIITYTQPAQPPLLAGVH